MNFSNFWCQIWLSDRFSQKCPIAKRQLGHFSFTPTLADCLCGEPKHVQIVFFWKTVSQMRLHFLSLPLFSFYTLYRNINFIKKFLAKNYFQRPFIYFSKTKLKKSSNQIYFRLIRQILTIIWSFNEHHRDHPPAWEINEIANEPFIRWSSN